MIAYNLLRRQMHQTADKLGVPPTQLSFQGFTRAIVAELRHAPLETPGAFPARLARLHNKPAPICCLHDDDDLVPVK